MTALVITDAAMTRKLLDEAQVRIGWVNCQICKTVTVVDYGHVAGSGAFAFPTRFRGGEEEKKVEAT